MIIKECTKDFKESIDDNNSFTIVVSKIEKKCCNFFSCIEFITRNSKFSQLNLEQLFLTIVAIKPPNQFSIAYAIDFDFERVLIHFKNF